MSSIPSLERPLSPQGADDAKESFVEEAPQDIKVPAAPQVQPQRKEGDGKSGDIELPPTQNPLLWHDRKKWAHVACISWSGFLSPLASSIIAPAIELLAEDLGVTSDVVAVLPVSAFVLGLGIGPFLLSPLSEAIGRRWVYIGTGAVFLLFNIGCALCRSMAALCVVRLLAGAMGSTGPCLGAASIGDMFKPAERGRAVAIYALGPILGPSIGNLLGAWIAERTHTWTWPFWVVSAASASIPILSWFLSETYAPVLLAKRRRLLNSENGEPASKRMVRTLCKEIVLACKRPFKLMFTNPICSVFALYQAYMYGILYLAFTTFPIMFSGAAATPKLFNYGWSLGVSGLVYVPLGLGSLSATMLNYFFSNRLYAWFTHHPDAFGLGRSAARGISGGEKAAKDLEAGRPNGPAAATTPSHGPTRKGKPEYRLPFCCIAMVVLGVGLFWFGWAAEAHTFWLVTLLGVYLIGVGATLSFQCLQMYLVDAFIPFSASAIAVSVLLRSILGAVFPLFGKRLYTTCGYGWGNSILGFLSFAVVPVAVAMVFFGERARKRFVFKG